MHGVMGDTLLYICVCQDLYGDVVGTNDLMKTLLESNDDLRKKVASLEKKVSSLQERTSSSKKIKLVPSREERVSLHYSHHHTQNYSLCRTSFEKFIGLSLTVMKTLDGIFSRIYY